MKKILLSFVLLLGSFNVESFDDLTLKGFLLCSGALFAVNKVIESKGSFDSAGYSGVPDGFTKLFDQDIKRILSQAAPENNVTFVDDRFGTTDRIVGCTIFPSIYSDYSSPLGQAHAFHEIGHCENNHCLRTSAAKAVSAVVAFSSFVLPVNSMYKFITFGAIAPVVLESALFWQKYLHEYEADTFALDCSNRQQLVASEKYFKDVDEFQKKLNDKNKLRKHYRKGITIDMFNFDPTLIWADGAGFGLLWGETYPSHLSRAKRVGDYIQKIDREKSETEICLP